MILLLIGINVLLIYLYHNKAAPSPSPPLVPPTPAMLPSVATLDTFVKPLATATSSSATTTTTTAARGGSLLAPQHHAAPLRVTFSPPLLAKKKVEPVVLPTNAAKENTNVGAKNTVSTPLGSATLGSAMALKEMAAKDEAAEIDEHLGRLGNLGRFKAVQTTLTTVKDTVQKSGRLRKV